MNDLRLSRSQLIVGLLTLCFQATVVAGDWTEPVCDDASTVHIRCLDHYSSAANWTYIVCHGMGGTSDGDRFDKLCRAIQAREPNSNVLLIDWTTASRHTLFGFPNPWQVAKEIKPVARQAVSALRDLKLDPAKTTAIGESFGVYVIAEIAAELGGVEHVLGFNPANEHGGYAPPDLRKCAERAWSFHTYSPFDTTCEIAHGDFFLQTPAGCDHIAQHRHGITWLTERVAVDASWLRLEKSLPPTKPNAFRCQALLSGELLDVAISRTRPQPVETEPLASAR
jgi:hypothetical protein